MQKGAAVRITELEKRIELVRERCFLTEAGRLFLELLLLAEWDPDLKKYEKFVNDWHYFLLDVQEVLYNAEDPDLIRNLNLFVVNRFYLKPYDQNQDLYIQFYERLKEGKELLALA